MVSLGMQALLGRDGGGGVVGGDEIGEVGGGWGGGEWCSELFCFFSFATVGFSGILIT